MTWKAHNAL